MTTGRLTRQQLLVAAVPVVAAGSAAAIAAAGGPTRTAMTGMDMGPGGMPLSAMMIGEDVPAPGGPHDLDPLLYPPGALPHRPGRLREYTVVGVDRRIEVADGVFFDAWTYNGTVPGPVLRATVDDLFRVRFENGGSHPHSIHFHGIHPAAMDGTFEIVEPGASFTYEFPARPAGVQLYHCHAFPLKKHIARGLYGAFIIDPAEPRPDAQELVMVMSGFDTDGDGENNFYGVNGPALYYAKYPIRVSRARTVRIYLVNMTEFDLINSFHLHGEFFRWYATGTTDRYEYTDTVMLCQGQRGIVEIDFHHTGRFMFHAHQTEFTELGWMGFFEVTD
jgi:FtsP/CotA-like multicopper oxidase with cupredoxin domain